jgi:hypothetical protein
MATINIDNLRPAGAELFDDSEGFMDKLSNDEIGSIYGGFTDVKVETTSGTCTCPGKVGFALSEEQVGFALSDEQVGFALLE